MLLGICVMLIGLIFPFILAKHPTGLNQSLCLVVMVGMASAFVHGAGFQPRPRILHWLTSPGFAWPVTLLGLSAMAYLR